MKKILFLSIFLLTLFSALPQNLRVENGVKLLERDITASRFPRNDSKGKPCALIKVRSSEPNLTFSGDVCGNVDYDKATYLVYMTAGSNQLTVSNGGKNKLSLKFDPLMAKSTYETTILETSDKGELSLTTNPSGAEVFLIAKGEKIFIGKTPIKRNVSIKTGVYRIEIEKKGYQKWSKKNVTISKNKTTDLGKIKLKTF